MTRAPYILLALASILFVAAAVHLANQQLAAGAVYPELSSFRADPDGAKLLYDALSRFPALTLERNFTPLADLRVNHAAVLVLGVRPQALDLAEENIRALEGLARAGNRVVLAFHYERSLTALKLPNLQKAWDVQVATDRSPARAHPFFFRDSPAWTPLSVTAGNKVLAMERPMGEGSIFLSAESRDFANAAVLTARNPELLSQAVGDASRILFDESHLGLQESGSVVGLARQFGLLGFAAGFALLAILFLWKNVPIFPPPAATRDPRLGGITAQAGLATLLRRHIPARDLPAVCWRAWLETSRNSAPPEKIARAEQVLQQPAASPAAALQEIAAVLQSKGTP